MYGTSTAASEPLQQLGADTLIKPTHASFTRRKLREHRLAVVQAAQAAEEHAAALQANVQAIWMRGLQPKLQSSSGRRD